MSKLIIRGERNMKKILFVCNALKNGGAERVVSVLSEVISEMKYDIYILPLIDKEQVYNVGHSIQVIESKKNKKISRFDRILEIRKCIDRYKIETIIAFSYYNAMFAIIAATGKKIKIIGSERNDPAQEKGRKILNFARRILYKRLDYLVCQTDDAKDYFPKDIQKKTVIILNPLKRELPDPYFGEREKRIVSFSRLDQQKNIPMLIDAFEMLQKEYQDYRLEIYGDGPQKGFLQNYIAQHNLSQKIKIFPFDVNIHEKVLKSKLFALASNYEGLSNSMLEAMALGLPTIVTDCPCGGARMVINNGENGIFIPVGNAYLMYQAMKKVIDDVQFAEKLSRNAIAVRQLLDANKIAKDWISIIEE